MADELCTWQDVWSLVGDSVTGVFTETQVQALCEGDANTQGLIDVWSAWFEKQVGIAFERTTGAVIYLDGQGTNQVFLPSAFADPSVTALSYDVSGVLTDVTEFDTTDSGVIRLTGYAVSDYATRASLPRFSRGRGNVKVTLDYGYSTVPVDVRAAVARLTAIDILGLYDSAVDQGVKSRRLGDRQESWGAGKFSSMIERWRTDIDATLRLYRSGVRVDGAVRTG